MEFILPLVYFLLANVTMVFMTKKSFGKCIVLTMISSVFTLYISQILFKTFMVGIVVNIIFALSGIVVFIILFFKDKEKFNIKKKLFFSNGLIIFIAMYVLVYIFDLNRVLKCYDDFMHWGVMVKELARLDNFYSVAESTLIAHKDYPPVIQIYELFYAKISTALTDSVLLRSVHLLRLVFFIPVLSEIKFKSKNIPKTVIYTIVTLGLVCLAILTVDKHSIINSLYVDYIMAIILAYLIYFVVTEKNILSTFNLFNICMILTFMVMIKQIAICFYALIIFGIAIKILLKYKFRFKINKKVIIKTIEFFILVVFIPFLFFKGWNLYISTLQIQTDYVAPIQFESKNFELNKLPGILKGSDGEKWQREACINYIEAIIKTPITRTVLQISFLQCSILSLAILFICCKKLNKKNKLLVFLIVVLGLIGYVFVIGNTYIFLFGEKEGPGLSSYDRYMATYIITIISLSIMLFIHRSKEKYFEKIIKILIIISLGLLLIQNSNDISFGLPALKDKYQEGYDDAKILEEKTEELAKIFILAPNKSRRIFFSCKYYANPRVVNQIGENMWPTEEGSDLSESSKAYILKFDYLYTQCVSQEFIQKYSKYFINGELKEKCIYKICQRDGELQFELVR